jgi:hypothetical protein
LRDGQGYRRIHIVTEPTNFKGTGWPEDAILLPYAANPREAWKGIRWADYRCAFMHQTVTGAISENGMKMENPKMPLFPRTLKVYSGDIHVPQRIGRVEYVGAPHPIKFGDKYKTRFLLLNDAYDIEREILLYPKQKHMLEIGSIEELEACEGVAGDQARIRYRLPISAVGDWYFLQTQVAGWAEKRGITLASVEAQIETPAAAAHAQEDRPLLLGPLETLQQFGDDESIDPYLLEHGTSILKSVLPK